MKWRAFSHTPQWVRLSDLFGRTGGSVQTQPALDERTGLARAQGDAGRGASAGPNGMRPTLTDEVLWCNKGRTQDWIARRITPARSANHKLAK
ncbi:hypothetical protein AQPW35_16370 [Rubrivivax pictus]|uniref:Uncharacterized protein n=1 Tax=Pseudaquabacterium pictum TaxID=2315236 RepID=A0A480ANH7_9BURK|nr:hypothetical protein AQPW35_16370 [Rubrivivax pictus]